MAQSNVNVHSFYQGLIPKLTNRKNVDIQVFEKQQIDIGDKLKLDKRGEAYFGFTATTGKGWGSSYSEHKIRNINFQTIDTDIRTSTVEEVGSSFQYDKVQNGITFTITALSACSEKRLSRTDKFRLELRKSTNSGDEEPKTLVSELSEPIDHKLGEYTVLVKPDEPMTENEQWEVWIQVTLPTDKTTSEYHKKGSISIT